MILYCSQKSINPFGALRERPGFEEQCLAWRADLEAPLVVMSNIDVAVVEGHLPIRVFTVFTDIPESTTIEFEGMSIPTLDKP